MELFEHPAAIATIAAAVPAVVAIVVMRANHKHSDATTVDDRLAKKVDETDCIDRLDEVKKRFDRGDGDFKKIDQQFSRIKAGMVAMYEQVGGDGIRMAEMLNGRSPQ